MGNETLNRLYEKILPDLINWVKNNERICGHITEHDLKYLFEFNGTRGLTIDVGRFSPEYYNAVFRWFKADDVNLAYQLSQTFTNNCPYALYKDYIEINPTWVNYLQSNSKILKDFCYWNLSTYLQSKNPNVPDIPNKLIKLPVRKGLNLQRKQFWDIVIGELGSVDCIYTNKPLRVGNYAVEHFVPYAFVSHDLMWNLIPADRSFNSSKSDRLPILDNHFDKFFTLQQYAVEIIQYRSPQNKFLEDYLSIFPDLNDTYFNRDKFFEHIQPLVTIASNNGFQYLSV